ncbi:hypothetical protein DMC14_000640 [Metamycoplasma phocicerebrale]|uniref:Uncharacterized protein n=1 Tax=Metamycoplasma phocicerebrale TaxID=142649 RepID=A0A3T0TTL3_9BACT|nr:hypothetical protein [Metamycoplasma phocicerebrale]AZZ65309.1 hypothetical protein DMC14_000640 [Metamycoplasma phocicerebrale]
MKLAKSIMIANIVSFAAAIFSLPLFIVIAIALGAAGSGIGSSYTLLGLSWGTGVFAIFYFIFLGVASLVAWIYSIVGCAKAFQDNETVIGVLFLIGVLSFPLLSFIASILYYKASKNTQNSNNSYNLNNTNSVNI